MNRPTVLVADDHEPMHEVIRRLIDPEFQVVLSVLDGPSLVDAARTLDIDVLIVDISMPEQDGIRAVTEIIDLQGETAPDVVFLTTYNDAGLVERALEIGAVGYVLKESAADHLIPALRAVLGGASYLSPGVEAPS